MFHEVFIEMAIFKRLIYLWLNSLRFYTLVVLVKNFEALDQVDSRPASKILLFLEMQYYDLNSNFHYFCIHNDKKRTKQ